MRNTKSKDLVGDIDNALTEFTGQEHPVTVRQCYYHLVSRGLIEKTEKEYGWTSRRLTKLRRDGVVPYEWVADNTRWTRKPSTFDGLSEVLGVVEQSYRRPIWQDQDCYVEIWLEKDALAGVVSPITMELDVPLNVVRGYPSVSFLHDAARPIRAACEAQKPVFLYYFGDLDATGQDIPRSVEQGLREFGCDFEFELSAVLREHVEELNLPTRPSKKKGSLDKKWEGDCVELDAIPPATLREMVQGKIGQHLDVDKYRLTLETQEVERALCTKIAHAWDKAPKAFMKMLDGPKRRKRE